VNCRNCIIELVENARTGSQPDAELQKHLGECPRCRERWDDEQSLSTQLRLMRYEAWSERRSGVQRDAIMQEFAMAHRGVMLRWVRSALNLAAMVLLTVALGLLWRNNRQADDSSKNRAAQESLLLPALPEDDDFIAVPYAPPLAPGEFLRVVRTELRPNALARMGIYVDASLSEMPADVVYGEDGFPRAVHMLEDVQF